ncbi:mitochondrial import receptor subunit TOM6 homolog [Branchiostoma floridae x Branchiostoma belcheri]
MAAVRNVIDAIKDLYKNPFKRSLIVNLSLFVAGVWAARNLSDFDPMAPPQPAVTS